MHQFIFLLASALALVSSARARPKYGPLVVDNPPTFVRPYVLPYLKGDAWQLGTDIYRLPVTNASSGGLFSWITLHGMENAQIPSHIHRLTHETFFCIRGAVNFWADTEARSLLPHDFAAVPTNNVHSFQLSEPDSVHGSMGVPGGQERWIYDIGTPYSSPIDAPTNPTRPVPFPVDRLPQVQTPEYDIYPQPDAPLARILANGTSDPNTPWHNGNNTLPGSSGRPYFVANNRGPKYLHRALNQVIAPLQTLAETEGSSSIGTITLGRSLRKQSTQSYTFDDAAQMFQVLEGELSLTMAGQSANMRSGDVAFIPRRVQFKYWSQAPYTKVLVAAAGGEALLDQLIQEGEEWGHALFPAF